MKADEFFKDDYTALLKKNMVENGVTVTALAKKIGYSYEGTRKILRGEGSYWGTYKICRALKVKITDIMDVTVE